VNPADLPVRPGPTCNGNHRTPVVRLSGSEIVAGNWSYRQSDWSWNRSFLSHRFTIGRCRDCGFVYADTELPEAFLRYVYDELIDCGLRGVRHSAPIVFRIA
jgi:hypothetical protein